jgi:glycosyltransferase involved in cell wall biosynthesis
MATLDQVCPLEQQVSSAAKIPVSVIVPVRNEAHNLPRCLASLRRMGEVYVIDSGSSDNSVEIARSFGAKVIQFKYQGGWPKKRQWAMDTLLLAFDWVMLIDADEALTAELQDEIGEAIATPGYAGYHIKLQMHFLGRRLRHCGAGFYKMSLFRRHMGHFECRVFDQDNTMCDMEVHEHVVLDGKAGKLKHPLLHHNVESLSRYIRKHDEYSNWEAKVWQAGKTSLEQLPPALFGTQAQRRRWIRTKLFAFPGTPFLFFVYRYFFRLGFLDGIPGLIYCALQGIQFFHIKAKIYESKLQQPNLCAE